MSLWQFAACVDGHNRANSPDEVVDPPTTDEFHDLVRRLG